MNKIIEFQKQNNLEPDGLLGKNTFAKMKEVWKIKLDEQLANFLGQFSIESANFTANEENTNYSKEGLLKTFPKYFSKDIYDKDGKLIQGTASLYAKQPKKIANRAYANRMGNGNEESGDGYKYKGVGGLQLTGADNYKDFSKWVGSSTKLTTEEIATKYFWETGLYYFDKNKLWELAAKVDNDSITKLSKAINLGDKNSKKIPNHLKERIENTNKYYNLIKK